MAIVTTASITRPIVRCELCRREAWGGLTVAGPDGRFAGYCCAREGDRQLLRTMIDSETPMPGPPAPTIVGRDPLRDFNASPAAILAAQGVEQTLTKNPPTAYRASREDRGRRA